MKTETDFYDLHVLVCTNDKSGGCAEKGGQEIVNQLKAWSKKAGLHGKIRVNQSGCLGRCEAGVACVAYPRGEWAINATPNDLDAIKEWIVNIDRAREV